MPIAVLNDFWNVTAEFRLVNAWGVGLMVVMCLAALGHFIKPLRCITKISHGILWLLVLAFFITANVIRFRPQGRACSLDMLEIDAVVTTMAKDWKAQGLF